MKQFFAKMNFARSIILLSVIGAIALGYLVYVKNAELKRLQLEVVDAEPLATKIQNKARLLTSLQRQADRERLKGESDPELYIRTVAQEDNVNIGQVDVNPSEQSAGKGIVDKKYRIRPSDKNRGYNRAYISNFLYRLEEQSRRVRVTHIKIDPVDRKIKPHEIGKDRWTFDVDLISRQAVE